MNLSNLFWRDAEEDAAAARSERQQALIELSQVNTALDMFKAPLWGYLKDVLEDIERSSLDALVSGTDSAEGAREKIKLARYLAKMEERFLQKQARLEEILKEEEING